MPIDRFACITVAVPNQEEALQWFVEKLGFEKRTDVQTPGMRFLTVSPAKQPELEVVLASWFPELVGKNATAVLHTTDCAETYRELSGRGVEFTQEPAARPWGVEAVFKDLCGNKYALVQRA